MFDLREKPESRLWPIHPIVCFAHETFVCCSNFGCFEHAQIGYRFPLFDFIINFCVVLRSFVFWVVFCSGLIKESALKVLRDFNGTYFAKFN